MQPLNALGFIDNTPASFSIDPASPRSFFAEEFLFRCDINPNFDSAGNHCHKASLSIPSLGGFYISEGFTLSSSITSKSDVVLGSDWLSQCKPVIGGSVLGLPTRSAVEKLPAGHGWNADGTLLFIYCDI